MRSGPALSAGWAWSLSRAAATLGAPKVVVAALAGATEVVATKAEEAAMDGETEVVEAAAKAAGGLLAL